MIANLFWRKAVVMETTASAQPPSGWRIFLFETYFEFSGLLKTFLVSTGYVYNKEP